MLRFPPFVTILKCVSSSLLVGGMLTALVPQSADAQAAVLAADSFNRKVHVASQANEKRPVGGLAKVATAMVTLDWAAASKAGVNILATVPAYAPQIAGNNVLGLQPGDRLTLRDLIYATMMTSDDLAAITLGDFVGRDHLQRLQRTGDPLVEFVRQMNQLAAREGATHTKFTNPHGYENTRAVPYSTAADMARLGLYAISRPALRFYTNQRTRDITVYRGDSQMNLPLNNTNQLLGVSNIDGLKYTSTPRSGGCIVVTAERPSSVTKQADGSSLIYRHRMVVVVIGSANPAAEAHALLQQSWAAYDRWLAAGRPITDERQLLNHF
ncbi:D-alanyl-D-alanine carboxypeptidase [Prosthecobacter debontii]|uniref:D-alanyl-D-alanine carboxypeptidase n=1 Tax=Prosthecobacter debontii TaxID=48467 RepID=A0A1T4YPM7_9BACT|nr:serine hydrolase [Prosthecobacter debontii]SKB03686.1 D-alanyl-D-alanine carboxypeptidase [Prosthecobacter debontii]